MTTITESLKEMTITKYFKTGGKRFEYMTNEEKQEIYDSEEYKTKNGVRSQMCVCGVWFKKITASHLNSRKHSDIAGFYHKPERRYTFNDFDEFRYEYQTNNPE